ncbi:cytochrome c-type biogenesis protein CcmH [Sphingomonas sp.]|uniref:cytochrome c-type biogenesis protein n=1 Tax=Sphingomonas sp. TaxID=28214 RepID=UPI00345CBD2F
MNSLANFNSSCRHPELVSGSIYQPARLWQAARRTLKRVQRDGLWIAAVFLLIGSPAHANSSMPKAHYADTQLADPRQEADAHALMESVRCLVCQGQSIADSDADLAADMRAMIRRRIKAGEKPEAIRRWLIERYGDWVSYKPVLDAATAPLWIAPFLLIAIGLWLARGRFRKRRR